MSHYTTEVRFICEQAAGYTDSQGANSVNTVVTKAYPSIFGSFPLFDENYRTTLCTKILKHYYLREICCETVGIWKMWLNQKMNEIMPYYNKLYESELIKFDPMKDADYTKTGDTHGTHTENRDTSSDRGKTTHNEHEDENNGTTTVDDTVSTSAKITDSHDNTNQNMFSETPQGGLSGVDNLNYLTDYRKIKDDYNGSTDETRTVSDDGTTTVNAKTDGSFEQTEKDTFTEGVDTSGEQTEDYFEHLVGKFPGKSYSVLLREFRETFLNIDMMIIDELKDLFFLLY